VQGHSVGSCIVDRGRMDILDEPTVRGDKRGAQFAKVLPCLFFEYLAISLARSLIPGMIVREFGDSSYLAVGVIETIKGVLAFVSCPAFGRLSDRVGRKYCLLVTVTGTTLPICLLAFTSNMYIYAVVMSLSGVFSATFPLTFAYISDCVDKKNRAPAYGLALATFGLSFCLGPLTGSYLAAQISSQSVFLTSLALVFINIIYIVMYLPETVTPASASRARSLQNVASDAFEYLPNSWNISETFRVFGLDPFMTNLAVIVFLYYTSVWAIVSTLMVFVTRHLHFDPVTLGWLLSGYGFATMFSEGVLVRIIVPLIGETNSMRLGLAAFAVQCIVVAFSRNSNAIFVSVLFSMFANLVYPSISSLVSKIVEEDMQGEALGALNGIKALTEGFGPLTFGLLMALFEKSTIPGAPYLIASVLSCWALLHCYELPPQPELVTAKFNARKKGREEAEGLLKFHSADCAD